MSPEWLQWYYLIFLLPAAVAMLVLLLGGLGGHHGGHGHGAHAGGHFHGHHGLGGHGHAHARAPGAHSHAGGQSHGAHGPHTAHGSHADQHQGSGSKPAARSGPSFAGFFGFGRAPVTVVVGSLMIGWGLFGVIALEALRPLLGVPLLFVPAAVAAGLTGSILSARFFGSLAARFMPEEMSTAISVEGLLGQHGKVVYAVSDGAGRVHIYDQHRTLHSLSARVAPGGPTLEKGTDVIVASLDPERRYLIVEPLGFSMKSPDGG